jgi:uncharacterized protein DUF4238
MSGRKQHFIPQVLQRGFQAATTGKRERVVVYKRGRPSYFAPIGDNAAEHDFYSRPREEDGDRTLDDHITDFESKTIRHALRYLKNSPAGAPVDADKAATLVSHLAVRSAHVRKSYTETAQAIARLIGEVLRDPSTARQWMEIDSSDAQSTTAKMIAEELDSTAVASLPEAERQIIQRIGMFRLREVFERAIEQMSPQLLARVEQMIAFIPSAASRGHARALELSLAPIERVSHLRELNWSLLEVNQDGGLVLPDCVVVSEVAAADSRRFVPYAFTSDEEIAAVLMPLSTTQLLVGSKKGEGFQIPPSLNREFARCSLEFFVASREDTQLAGLADQIGTAPTEVRDEILAEERSYRSRPAKTELALPAQEDTVRVAFGPGVVTNRKLIERIAREQLEKGQADRIESVLIVHDVAAAVAANLGRPVNDFETHQMASGTIMPDRNAPGLRVHVLVPARFVPLLLQNPSKPEAAGAAYLLRHNLGRASFLDSWERVFPGYLQGPAATQWAWLRRELVASFASHYWGAVSATENGRGTATDIGLAMPLWCQVVQNCLAGLGQAREKYGTSDIPALTRDALTLVDLMLQTLASACGACEGKDLMIEKTQLSELLRTYGLDEWLRIFDQDLRQLRESRGSWQSVNELLDMSVHAERVLWEFGTLLTATAEGAEMTYVADDRLLTGLRKMFRDRGTIQSEPDVAGHWS